MPSFSLLGLLLWAACTMQVLAGPPGVSKQIIGGSLATRNQWPWQVAVLSTTSGARCGGSLISNQWVLTAAHCVDKDTSFTVTVGATDRSVFEDAVVSLNTMNKIIHAQWNATGKTENDIALLKLPITLPVPSTYWNTIRLPSQSMVSNTLQAAMSWSIGWGKISDSALSGVQQLRYVQSYIIGNDECAKTFSTLILPTTICTLGNVTNTAKGLCNGDSGGPMVTYHSDGLYTLAGISSFVSGLGCEKMNPSAYTRVSSYLSWISGNTGIAIRP